MTAIGIASLAPGVEHLKVPRQIIDGINKMRFFKATTILCSSPFGEESKKKRVPCRYLPPGRDASSNTCWRIFEGGRDGLDKAIKEEGPGHPRLQAIRASPFLLFLLLGWLVAGKGFDRITGGRRPSCPPDASVEFGQGPHAQQLNIYKKTLVFIFF